MGDEMRRKTLAEMARESNGSAAWECPRCGCRDWRVEDSYYVASAGERRRRRFCRNCKQVLHTREVPIEPLDTKEAVSGDDNATNSTAEPFQLTVCGVVGLDARHDDADHSAGSHRIRRARA